jgi:hypothetical protein
MLKMVAMIAAWVGHTGGCWGQRDWQVTLLVLGVYFSQC